VSRISPFVGLLFDRSIVGSYDLVTTPPYDVISDAQRRHLFDASPYNVIRLVLGPDGAGGGEADDQYRHAADELGAWRARGALAPTDGPAFFPYEMRFSLHGRPRAIRGLVCAVELEDWGGSVVPHEQTMPGPIEDRLRLMRAVRTNLSSIHAVFRGPSEPFAAFVDRETAREPAASTSDESGVEHRLWVSDPNPDVTTWLEPESMMIADGHHRYSMALRYRDEMRASRGPGPWDRVMMFVADAAVQEPPVLPFHRIQTDGPFQAAGDRVRDLGEVLETVDDGALVYGSASLEDGLLVHRVADLTGAPPAVCALHEQVLHGLDERLRYTPDAVEAEDAVRARTAVAAYFLPPTDAMRIRDVIDRGERLPQKSTFFWPKPRTGLVLRPLDLDDDAG
jgi:uncharacterized protein (DUF1015 family)